MQKKTNEEITAQLFSTKKVATPNIDANEAMYKNTFALKYPTKIYISLRIFNLLGMVKFCYSSVPIILCSLKLTKVQTNFKHANFFQINNCLTSIL